MLRALLLLLVAWAATACGPRYARVTLQDHSGLKIQLRSQQQQGKPLDRGFAHPATISGVRIASILSRIDVRLESSRGALRDPAFHTELLYDLGDALSAALSKANSNQEVVVCAIRKERRLGIFTQEYLTSFVTYVEGDDLYIHLSRVNYGLPKNSDQTIPEPWPNLEVMRFTVLPGDGIVPVGRQAVTAAWRDPIFRSASHVRLGPTGSLMRREILFESPEEATEDAAPEVTEQLSPATLRALADLEESRGAGSISEAEYQERRRSILADDPAERPRP